MLFNMRMIEMFLIIYGNLRLFVGSNKLLNLKTKTYYNNKIFFK